MNEKAKFLLKNLFKALLYFAALILLYILFDRYIADANRAAWSNYINERTPLIYLSYICSEVFFGILPPEIYMKWALHKQGGLSYWQDVTLFAIISYGAGVLSFYIGRWLKHAYLFQFLSRKAFKNLWPQFRKFGSVLIIAAALTPIPWALVSMLIGTTEYPIKNYLLFALFRLLRFAVYGYIVFYSMAI